MINMLYEPYSGNMDMRSIGKSMERKRVRVHLTIFT